MSQDPRPNRSGLSSQVRTKSDQVVWIMLGVVGFILLLATLYVLAMS